MPFLLQNRTEIIQGDDSQDDVVVVPYFTDIRFVTLKVYSVGKKGWSAFHVKIYGTDSKSILIRVPNSPDFFSEYIMPTDLDLFPLETAPSKIPKTIVQTASFSQWNDPCLKNTSEILRAFNPDCEYIFFSDNDCRKIVLEYGCRLDPRIIDVYDTLIPDAFKADLFRYIYLYFFGGWYFDYKLVMRANMLRKYTEDTLVLCADYERSNHRGISNMESVYNGMIGTIPGSSLFLKLISACISNVLDRQRDFLLDIERRGTQGILDLTGPKLFYKELSDIPNYSQYIKLKHFIKNHDESSYKNFQIQDLESSELVVTKFGSGTPPRHYSLLWVRKLLFFQDPKVITADTGFRYKILTYPTGMIGFRFAIKNQTLKVNHDVPWSHEIAVRIIDILTHQFIDVLVGKSDLPEKMVPLEAKIFEDLPVENVHYIDRFPSRDLHSKVTTEDLSSGKKRKKTIIAVTSVIFTSNNEIGEKEARSVITHLDRYNQTVEQLEILRRKAPNDILVLLEGSIKLPKSMLKTLSRIADYVITFFDQDRLLEPESEPDKERLMYFHQHRNKSLGETYSIVHFYDILEPKNLDFSHFLKLSGRYCPDSDFELEMYLQDAPVVTDHPGECQTVFYSMPKQYLAFYMEYLRLKIDPRNYGAAESTLAFFLNCLGKYHIMDYLRITGIGATHGRQVKL